MLFCADNLQPVQLVLTGQLCKHVAQGLTDWVSPMAGVTFTKYLQLSGDGSFFPVCTSS